METASVVLISAGVSLICISTCVIIWYRKAIFGCLAFTCGMTCFAILEGCSRKFAKDRRSDNENGENDVLET